jgi:hypothetical protein
MREHRTLIIAVVLLALTAAVGFYFYQYEKRRRIAQEESVKLDAEASVLGHGAAPSLPVKLYVYKPGSLTPDEQFLYTEDRAIFETQDTVLKARQIVNEVLKSRPLFSNEAKLRQIYILPDGTAIVDISEQTVRQLAGGVTSELAAILSITRSLRGNIAQIQRVRFLVEGEETETFAGHVSIRAPFM